LSATAIQAGAEWADPLLAAILLGVLGVCWWHSQAWDQATEAGEGEARSLAAARHVDRARLIGAWTQAALVVTVLGAVSLLLGVLVENSNQPNLPSIVWSRDAYVAASSLAVVAISVAGIWAGRRLRDRFTSTGSFAADSPGD
jgi:hypothetical protein